MFFTNKLYRQIEEFFFFQAEEGIRRFHVTGVQTCALPISAAARARGLSGAALAGGGARRVDRVRSRDRTRAVAAVSRGAAARGAGECARGAGDAAAARARPARGAARSGRAGARRAARVPRRLVRRLARVVRSPRRRTAVRPGQLDAGRPGARRLRPPRGGLCLAGMAELKPVYVISGSDRPKIRVAIERLRNRFEEGAVEVLAAGEHPAEDAVAACNALGLFGGERRLVIVEDVDAWKAPEAKTIATYLKNPAPETVLALVASELKKDSALAKACAKAGDVLIYDAPRKRDLPGWVAKQFEQHRTSADRDACRLLVALVGEDPEQLRSEIEKLATWSGGEPVSEADVRLLASLSAETSVFVLTDAWGRRDLALKGGSRLDGELEFERALVEVTPPG